MRLLKLSFSVDVEGTSGFILTIQGIMICLKTDITASFLELLVVFFVLHLKQRPFETRLLAVQKAALRRSSFKKSLGSTPFSFLIQRTIFFDVYLATIFLTPLLLFLSAPLL